MWSTGHHLQALIEYISHMSKENISLKVKIVKEMLEEGVKF